MKRIKKRARAGHAAPGVPETAPKAPQQPQAKLLRLQHQFGNQAVQRMAKSGVLQAKLKMGKAGDRYEREADSVADKVVGMSDAQVSRKEGEEEVQKQPLAGQITPLVQKSENEEETQAKLLQRAEKEEEPVQKKENEEEPQAKLLQRAEKEEEPVQKKG